MEFLKIGNAQYYPENGLGNSDLLASVHVSGLLEARSSELEVNSQITFNHLGASNLEGKSA